MQGYRKRGATRGRVSALKRLGPKLSVSDRLGVKRYRNTEDIEDERMEVNEEDVHMYAEEDVADAIDER